MVDLNSGYQKGPLNARGKVPRRTCDGQFFARNLRSVAYSILAQLGWQDIPYIGDEVGGKTSSMSKRTRTKLVHEGSYVAEMEIELLEDPEGWAPYLSLEDAYRLDDVEGGSPAG